MARELLLRALKLDSSSETGMENRCVGSGVLLSGRRRNSVNYQLGPLCLVMFYWVIIRAFALATCCKHVAAPRKQVWGQVSCVLVHTRIQLRTRTHVNVHAFAPAQALTGHAGGKIRPPGPRASAACRDSGPQPAPPPCTPEAGSRAAPAWRAGGCAGYVVAGQKGELGNKLLLVSARRNIGHLHTMSRARPCVRRLCAD